MTTVKAAVYSGSEHLDIRDVDLREPGRGEVRVRIGASGVCGSDRHVLDGDWEMPTPTIMGHEGAGVVEAVGDGVTSLEGVHGFALGGVSAAGWLHPHLDRRRHGVSVSRGRVDE